MLQVEQNLGYCIILSAVGGILEVFATAALAYPDAKKKEGSKAWGPSMLRLCLLVNVILQITASIVGNLLAPWFGPVSIVGPTFLSAQLVANMVIYGSVLGLECFTKDMRIGTAVIVTAAILLPVVGPQVQSNQDDGAADLMSRWYAHLWNGLLIFGMMATGIVLALRRLGVKCCQLRSDMARYVVLLTARATSFSVNLSYSKVFALQPTPPWLIASIVLKVMSGAVMTGSIVVQSTAVSQSTFVPLNATTVILVNALTGIVIWEDWRTVNSWLGYATVFVQLIVGNYLLLGEIDLFGPQNKRYGRRLLLRRIAGRQDLHLSDSSMRSLGDSHSNDELFQDNEKSTEEAQGEEEQIIASEEKVEKFMDEDVADIATSSSSKPQALSATTAIGGEGMQEAFATPTAISEEAAAAWLSSSPQNDKDEVITKQEQPTKPSPSQTSPFADAESPPGRSSSRPLTTKPKLARRAVTSCASSPSLGIPSPSLRRLHVPRPPSLGGGGRTGSTSTAGQAPSPPGIARRAQTTGTIHPRRQQQQQQHHHHGRLLHNIFHHHHEQTQEEIAAAAAKREAWEQVFGVSHSFLEQRGARLSFAKSFGSVGVSSAMAPIVEEQAGTGSHRVVATEGDDDNDLVEGRKDSEQSESDSLV